MRSQLKLRRRDTRSCEITRACIVVIIIITYTVVFVVAAVRIVLVAAEMKMRTCVSRGRVCVCESPRIYACVGRESRDRGGGCVSQAPLQHAAAWEVALAQVCVTTAKKPV